MRREPLTLVLLLDLGLREATKGGPSTVSHTQHWRWERTPNRPCQVLGRPKGKVERSAKSKTTRNRQTCQVGPRTMPFGQARVKHQRPDPALLGQHLRRFHSTRDLAW
jgi:hypothetical protein